VERAKRVGLRIAMLVVALNVWTGSPLLALWIGSRLQGSGPPKMGPIFVVVVAFAIISFTLTAVLARLGDAYDTMTGQPAQVHRHVAWLRSMRGERPQYAGVRAQVTALEQILIITVVACALAFEIWFFFFSSSPIDQRSGRGAVPVSFRARCAPTIHACSRSQPGGTTTTSTGTSTTLTTTPSSTRSSTNG
jgi:hypothetical protein